MFAVEENWAFVALVWDQSSVVAVGIVVGQQTVVEVVAEKIVVAVVVPGIVVEGQTVVVVVLVIVVEEETVVDLVVVVGETAETAVVEIQSSAVAVVVAVGQEIFAVVSEEIPGSFEAEIDPVPVVQLEGKQVLL